MLVAYAAVADCVTVLSGEKSEGWNCLDWRLDLES